jgi:hypothetical protein
MEDNILIVPDILEFLPTQIRFPSMRRATLKLLLFYLVLCGYTLQLLSA